jgi:phosphoribosyl-AMP cyclohydrolase
MTKALLPKGSLARNNPGYETLRVLMLGYTDREAYELTKKTKRPGSTAAAEAA